CKAGRHGGKSFRPKEKNHERHTGSGDRFVADLFFGGGQRGYQSAGGGLLLSGSRLRTHRAQRGGAARNFAGCHTHRGRPTKGETRPGERPLGLAAASVVVRREPVLNALPAVILFHLHPWPSRLADASRRPLERGVSLELGAGLLVSLLRAPATAHSLPGGSARSYADPHSLSLPPPLPR